MSTQTNVEITAWEDLAQGDGSVATALKDYLANELREFQDWDEQQAHRPDPGQSKMALSTRPKSPDPSSARRLRDEALHDAEPRLGRRHLAHLREIFATHDTKVDSLVGEVVGESVKSTPRLQRLHQELERRECAYWDLYREVLDQLCQQRGHAESSESRHGLLAQYAAEVASYFDDLTAVVERSEANTGAQEILALRTKRDLGLSILEMGRSPSDTTHIRDYLNEHDTTLDSFITASRVTGLDAETLDQARTLFVARLKSETAAAQSWLQVWIVGSAFGLMSIVVAFGWASWSSPPAWSWVVLCLAGLGALVAALYTYQATIALSTRTRWILVSLPVVVLFFALLLPLHAGQVPTATTLVAILVVLVLGVMSLRVVHHQPDRSRVRLLSSPSRHMMDTAFGDDNTDWTRYLVTDELEGLRSRISREGRTQGKASTAWATTFLLVGSFAALLSGAAGVAANQDESNSWVVGLAIGGAGLTALMTALNPGRRWEQARTLQLACESLEQEVRVLIRLDLDPNDSGFGRRKIDDISKMYDTLLGLPERPRLWQAPPGR